MGMDTSARTCVRRGGETVVSVSLENTRQGGESTEDLRPTHYQVYNRVFFRAKHKLKFSTFVGRHPLEYSEKFVYIRVLLGRLRDWI